MRTFIAEFAPDRFARHFGRTASTTQFRAEKRVREALEAVYRTFDLLSPQAIEGCPCCISTRGTDVLLTTPLRQLSGQSLWHDVTHVFHPPRTRERPLGEWTKLSGSSFRKITGTLTKLKQDSATFLSFTLAQICQH